MSLRRASVLLGVAILLSLSLGPHARAGTDVDPFVLLLQDGPFDPEGAASACSNLIEGRPEVLVELVDRISSTPGRPAWADAARRAIGLTGSVAVPGLRRALKDARPRVRSEAATIVAECPLENRQTFLPELTGALGDHEERVIAMASATMSTLGAGAMPAYTTLTNLLARAPPRLAAYYVHPLINLGPAAEPAIPLIKKALHHAQGSSGEQMVVFLDRSRADPEMLMPLFVVALKRQDWLMRRAAAFAITHHAEHGASAAPVLKDLLGTEQNPNVRYALAEALGTVDRSETAFALQVLLDLFHDESEEAKWARVHAITTLVEFGAAAQPALPGLLRLLDDNLEAALAEVRSGPASYEQRLVEGVIWVLGEIGPNAREALPALKRIARDGTFSVAIAAHYACFRIATEERDAYFRGLSDRLKTESADQALQTIFVLRTLLPDDSAAQQFLVDALDDDRRAIRLQAACALADAGVGGEKTRSVLVSGMNYHDARVRRECIRLLHEAARE